MPIRKDSMKKRDRSGLLREKRTEALAHPFPLTADLPDEFDDLYAEWVSLNEFVIASVEKVLKGQQRGTSHAKPKNLAYIHKRLRALEVEHPEIAPWYVEPFRILEELLHLLGNGVRA